MSKADTLLKKATSFEKLALYMDRTAFLQAIAQEVESFPPSSGLGTAAPYIPGTEPPVAKSTVPVTSEPVSETTVYMPTAKITGKSLGQQLVDTVNSYVQKMGPQTTSNMMDPKREAVAKHLDRNVMSEMLRLYQQAGGANNPYASSEEQKLTGQIKDAVKKFGETFSAQTASLPNYAKLSQLL